MNLALHGFLLQVSVLIFGLQNGFRLCSAGEPGYLDFDNLPDTNFSCQGKVIGGYYADVETGCQMFHVCTIGQKDEIMDIKFLCLNGTVFDQETRVCERVDEVDCSKSERFYNLNLELYGNHAVTLSLHDNNDEEDEFSESLDDPQQRTTSIRPITTTTTTSTTLRPIVSKSSSISTSGGYQHPNAYPQHYQPQPAFPHVHTSQSKSLYDDKNGGYHHQYIFHNGERNDNQATSYQLFSNQGSTTVQPPQVHQVRYTSSSNPQIIHNDQASTVTPLFHATSSTIQTLLNSNANNPALINPIFHNIPGIASTTEQFGVHNNNPRETSDYRTNEERNIRPLEAIQSTNQGKISKLTISPVPNKDSDDEGTDGEDHSQRHIIRNSFLPTPSAGDAMIKTFYPTPRTSSKPVPPSSTSSSSSSSSQVTQHIHVPPPVSIPHLKPHQITINLPPPDIQRIVQNPSPLLPSQSRVIVTAKASVSDESGRPLNSTQLVTLPISKIPTSYDDYKEGDVSFDPFYRDVPKIRNNRKKRSTLVEEEKTGKNETVWDLQTIGDMLQKFKSILFGADDYDSSLELNTTEIPRNTTDASISKDLSQEKQNQSSEDNGSLDDESNIESSFDDASVIEESFETQPRHAIWDIKFPLEDEKDGDSLSEDVSEYGSGSGIEELTGSTINDLRDSTEGILKFTDELPTTVDEKDNTSGSFDDSIQDYVDDNYEPENYKEIHNLTTTTFRSTSPKLFKPISLRKNYNYIPPTTPSNPVFIKPRTNLINPKPSKPLRSYNDLAPKPVIKKIPLLMEKITTENVNLTPYPLTRTLNNSSAIENITGESSLEVGNSTNEIQESDRFNSSDVVEIQTNSTTTETTYLSTSTDNSSVIEEPSWNSTDEIREADRSNSSDIVEVQTSSTTEVTHLESVSETVEPTTPSMITTIRKKIIMSFTCLDKELYRFYGDSRDCRLFHYCSPGFNARQVLDFRFVCEEGTAFDQDNQSCIHDVKHKCTNKRW